jgi:hypothetical protein
LLILPGGRIEDGKENLRLHFDCKACKMHVIRDK